jgi:hypothetical protein
MKAGLVNMGYRIMSSIIKKEVPYTTEEEDN